MKVVLIVLDSFGIGAMPDAHKYGDEGSNTYLNTINTHPVNLENMINLGLNNIDGWSHMCISFRGERLYENPFPGLRINDDEIAVTDLLLRMKKYLETGEEVSSLRDGLQDAYLDFMREEAVTTGRKVTTTSQSWV